jgi:hypothetical protein
LDRDFDLIGFDGGGALAVCVSFGNAGNVLIGAVEASAASGAGLVRAT